MNADEIINCEDKEQLMKFKEWLFCENIRLSTESKELEDKKALFIKERQDFRYEMNMLMQKTTSERQLLQEDKIFFEKKMDILRNGFDELDRDRRAFKDEKDRFQAVSSSADMPVCGAAVFFTGVDNPLTLKKRYRDLIKIYHPDNKAGDHDTFKEISEEYEKLRSEFEKDYSVV